VVETPETTALPLEFRGIPMTGSAAGIFELSVGRNQTVVVVGDENSGVDSLAAVALGLEPTLAGSALVYGTEIRELPRREQLAFRRRLGYLPAGDGLLSNLSLRDNVRLPLRFGSNFKPDEIEGRVDVILAMLRLTRVAAERPAQANEEQRRRAALGRALAFDPELVLLEQPFGGLTDRVAAELLEIARGGETAEGARRTVFITGQDIPMLLRTRVERVVHVADSRRMPSRV
jgi:ABC-type transporter Mla maintaining outer membrane lipid asymmetry ATPase subunit MlaF